MERIWSELDELDTFVHRKLQIYDWTPTSIKYNEMKRLQNNSTQLRNSKPLSDTNRLHIDSQRNLSSRELNLSSISKFRRTIEQRRLYNDLEAETDKKDDSSRNPTISSNTPLRFVMENELESPNANGPQREH